MSLATAEHRVKQVVAGIRNLPTPPIVFQQIQKVINNPSASASQVAAILAEDPAMSVKVLKLTNSAFYGLPREIDSVKQAVVIVGMEAVKNLVLSASVLDMFKGKVIDQEYQEKFWRHSLATAFCCRSLAEALKTRGHVDPDSVFSAGLLHDIGKIIMCCFMPEEHRKVLQAQKDSAPAPLHEIETNVLGFSHTHIGTALAAQWKLPHTIVDAIGNHHHPRTSDSDSLITYIVHIANYISKRAFPTNDNPQTIGAVDEFVCQRMRVGEDDFVVFCDLLRNEYLKAETFMKMAGLN